jgi:hypothetical protein
MVVVKERQIGIDQGANARELQGKNGTIHVQRTSNEGDGILEKLNIMVSTDG